MICPRLPHVWPPGTPRGQSIKNLMAPSLALMEIKKQLNKTKKHFTLL